MTAQRGVRYPEHEHVVRPVELHLVGPRAVAEGEIAGGERGLAAVLPVQAATVHLQVQEEHRSAGARDMQPGVPDELCFGEDLGDGHVTDPAPDQ